MDKLELFTTNISLQSQTQQTQQQPSEENPDGIYTFIAKPVHEKYYDENSAWGVFVIDIDKNLPHTQPHMDYVLAGMENKNETVYATNLTGKMQRLSIGVPYKVTAKQNYSKKFKQWQFEVISISNETPKTQEEQRVFLQSIATLGQANTLLKLYPNIVQDVVDGKDNIDLEKTKGIKEFTWNNIKEKILENYAISDILGLLIPLGISYRKVQTLLKGESNPQLLKQKLIEDPYVITEIDGISFKTADKIALELNPELKHSKIRVISFLKQYLKEYGEDNGSSWIIEEDLKNAVDNNLIECEDLFEEVLAEQKQFETFLHIENEKIGLHYHWFCEREVYRILNEINDSEPLYVSQEEINEGIATAERLQGFEFTEEQKNILVSMTKSNLGILTGLAGTGKSTLIRGLLHIYRNYNIACSALSARAAKRIEEVTGFEATTIHRMLGAKGLNEFEYNINCRMPYDIILVDEFSMIFTGFYYKIFQAIKQGAKLILVGDVGQLPPLGWGNLPTDIQDKPQFQINKLTKVHRQAERSGIIKSANLIRKGEDPLNGQKELKTIYGELQDMFFMARDNRESLNGIAIKTFMNSVAEVGVDNVQIVVPRKNNCINSTKELNKVIQDILLDDSLPFVKFGDVKYKLGSKVIHIKNNYEKNIFNGDIGYVAEIIDMSASGGSRLRVRYPDKTIEYTKSELKEIDMAYALTCHKLQGSQADVIIGIIDNSHFMLLDRKFLYTMITRASKKCLLLYEPYAFDKCIAEDKIELRNTWFQSFN